jgi:spore maturation protein CgeB
VLLVSLRHLLLSEIKNALDAIGHTSAIMMIPTEEMEPGRVERLYKEAIRDFRPDFLLTVNHLGFDREGLVTHILESMKIPIASWYVDSPYLILGHYKGNSSPMLTLFLWDRDYVPMLQALGLERVFYLPLGTDPTVFKPERNFLGGEDQNAVDVGFVGNSMVIKARAALQRSKASKELLDRYADICVTFLKGPHLIVRDVIRERFPELLPSLLALGEDRSLAFESSVIWQTTGWYRKNLLLQARTFRPTVAGDPGWQEILGPDFKLLREFNYYSELPAFYRSCRISFNATSRQMKNGVNQRVFDVPACGGFLLTDRTSQLSGLLDPGKELITYSKPDEIPVLLERALKDKPFRRSVREAGLKRVLAHHTYRHRVEKLIEVMRSLYS